jgi:hypothetical protein
LPRLGDYLGQLVSEITIARMHADLEAVRIAELYADHPLLRHMPIPRFRLPEIQLDVPVVIERMDEPSEGSSARGGATIRELRKSFDAALASQMRAARTRLKAEQRAELTRFLDEATARLERPAEVAIDVNRVADTLSKTATESLTQLLGPEKTQGIVANLRDTARSWLLRAQPAPPRLYAVVTTQELREAGPEENLTRIRLKVSEEALEWTQIELDGQTQNRLVPE